MRSWLPPLFAHSACLMLLGARMFPGDLGCRVVGRIMQGQSLQQLLQHGTDLAQVVALIGRISHCLLRAQGPAKPSCRGCCTCFCAHLVRVSGWPACINGQHESGPGNEQQDLGMQISWKGQVKAQVGCCNAQGRCLPASKGLENACTRQLAGVHANIPVHVAKRGTIWC